MDELIIFSVLVGIATAIYLGTKNNGFSQITNSNAANNDYVLPLSSPLITQTISNPNSGYLLLLSNAEIINGLPDGLLVKMAEIESNFNPNAYNSKSGASGIMQIVPYWHPGVDPFNAPDAIAYAGRLMSSLYAQFGSWKKAVAAYNWGSGNLSTCIKKYGQNWESNLPTETKNYLNNIQKSVYIN